MLLRTKFLEFKQYGPNIALNFALGSEVKKG